MVCSDPGPAVLIGTAPSRPVPPGWGLKGVPDSRSLFSGIKACELFLEGFPSQATHLAGPKKYDTRFQHGVGGFLGLRPSPFGKGGLKANMVFATPLALHSSSARAGPILWSVLLFSFSLFPLPSPGLAFWF